MLRFSYLFVQAEKSGTYKVLKPSFTNTLPDNSQVQALLDDATPKVCKLMEGLVSAQGLVLEAYTLVNPISSFLGQPMANIEEQIGDIDENFLKTKAVYLPRKSLLSSLEVKDGKIVVLVKMLAKRAHSLTETAFDRLKRTKLAMTAPSTTAQPSKYESNQLTPSQKILDDRPEPDADIPPIPLLYDGFGQFLDILDGCTNIVGLPEVDTVELQREVDDFARKMCLFYDTEAGQRDLALPILNRIFSARTGVRIPMLYPAAIGSIRAGGHNVGKHGGGILVTEFKNWSANNNAIAEVELAGYLAHLHAKGMEKHQELFERWRVPCLGLTVVGANVTFYAVVAVDHQYRVVSLTPGLSCIPSASDGRDRKALYKAFAAASVLQARILQDVERFLITPPPKIPASARRFPEITRLRKWRGSPSDYFTFQIQAFHPDRQGYRLLYVAETTAPEKQTIIIKFAREYSIELHDFCAQRDHAPPILAFKSLPGGWQVIAMEFIFPCDPIVQSPGLDIHRERRTTELQNLVDAFHDQGFVHGDLRDANIICDDKGKVMLIDFDWSGMDGFVFYPTPNLNDELLEGRTLGNLKITKDDDKRVLKRTLEKLKK